PKPHRLRSCLGLEAKNPGIVLADANLDIAVEECLLGSLSYNGQRCTALKILFVHYKIADQFIERFIEGLESLKIGLPWEDGVQVTPMPDLDKVNYVTELVDDACAHGARIINPNGGTVRETFFYPAVLTPINEKMRVYHEEQFGPIIPIVTFADIETPIRYIVESNYGQQVSVFGTDPNKIAELIDPLVNQVSRVNLNSQCQRGPDVFPFTGRKDSAELTLSVSDALRVFSIRTLVAAKNVELNQQIITSIVRDHKSGFLSTDFIF
ncbi:MAG: aldehyde dehydrogenase family protein, partial [Candidatus Saccharibacteria bacterium]